jgi:hypothetical protein
MPAGVGYSISIVQDIFCGRQGVVTIQLTQSDDRQL